MNGETDLDVLLKSMKPILNHGEFVFCIIPIDAELPKHIIASFCEVEGRTIVIDRQLADELKLPYTFIASWITLTVYSSLEAVGLTAAISQALANENISCNMIAAYYHDHIFVNIKDAENAMEVLNLLSA